MMGRPATRRSHVHAEPNYTASASDPLSETTHAPRRPFNEAGSSRQH